MTHHATVEVVLALEDRQIAVTLQVEAGTTIEQAIRLADLQSQAGELDLARAAVGIFGCLRERDAPLADGDRVEIYRPLRADPKAARRQRATEAARRGRRGFRGSATFPR